MKLRSILSALLLLGCVVAVTAADVRVWTDSRGKNKVKAKFISTADGKVTLEKEDGTQLEVELVKLSAADRKYVADQPKEKDDDNPFKPKGAAKPDAAETAIDWSGARMIDPAPVSDKWQIALPEGIKPATATRPVALPPTKHFFEKPKGVAVDAAGKRAVVGYTLQEPGRDKEATTRLLLCDLETGKIVNKASVTGSFAPVALHDDGRFVLRHEEFGHGKNDRLEIRTFDGDSTTSVARFTPYGDLQHGDRDVAWTAFLDDKRLITVGGGGKLAIWSLNPLKPELTLPIQSGCRPALSPDRKLVAYSTGKEVALLDVAAGKVLASQPLPPNCNWPSFAFSPAGRKLGCLAFDRILVWDLAVGTQLAEMGLTNSPINGPAHWVDEDLMLCGHRLLIDPVQQIKAWEYHNADTQMAGAGGVTWAVASEGDRKPGALLPLRLPHSAVRPALEKALADPNFFVLKKGTTVSIDVSGLADAGQQGKVEATLRKKLESNGCRVVPNGSISLVALTEVGKQREITYHTFGVAFGNKTYTVQEHFTKLQFVYQGKPAWQSSTANIPYFVRLKADQTMEQYLKEHEQPNYGYYDTVELPKLLTKPTGSAALGTSRVTPAGLN